MKERFVSFLFKRIREKIGVIGDEIEDFRHIEDLEMYIDELKEIVMEVVKP